jgi:hypothetical protein
MTRVIQGTKEELHVLVDSELPADKNLQTYFLRWVDATRFDFTGCDMRNLDALDSVFDEAIFPTHEIDGIPALDWSCFRRCSMTRAVIPQNISSYHHDFMTEIWKRSALSIPGQMMGNYVGDGSYTSSWQDGAWLVVNQWPVGVSDNERAWDLYSPLLLDYPRPYSRLDKTVRSRDAVKQEKPLVNPIYYLVGDENPYPEWHREGKVDRYLAGLDLEKDYPDLWFHVAQLIPFDIIIGVERKRMPVKTLGWWGAWGE